MYYKTGLGISVCVIIGLLIYILASPRVIGSQSENEDAEELHQIISELGKDVSTLQQKMRFLNMKSSGLFLMNPTRKEEPISGPETKEKKDEIANDTPLTVDESIQNEIVKFRQMADDLDNVIQREPVNDEWAFQIENTLSQFVEEFDTTKTRLNEVMCRSTLCRLELEHSDLIQNGRFVDELEDKRPFPWAEMIFFPTEHTENRLTSVVYFARDGHRIIDQL